MIYKFHKLAKVNICITQYNNLALLVLKEIQ